MNLTTWGATDADIQKALPGDDLVLNPRIVTTRAITIQASIAKVWPWLVQIGYKRAGWYSYDFIHRLLGCADSWTMIVGLPIGSYRSFRT